MSKHYKKINNTPLFGDVFYIILIIMVGLVMPAFLIPLIKLTGYPECLEEIAKWIVVILPTDVDPF